MRINELLHGRTLLEDGTDLIVPVASTEMKIEEVMTGRTVSRSARKALRRKREAQHRQPVTDDPWLMGDEAWHHGQDETTNPFQMGTIEFEDWQRGWREAQEFAARQSDFIVR